MSAARTLLFLCSSAALSLACAKPSADPVSHEPEHGDPGDPGDPVHHGHQGHQGHGAGGNGHGYKGHRFDDPAEWTAQFESAERTAWQKPDELIASLALRPTDRIADLGAGTGYFAVRFAAAAPEGKVYAVDIEPNMVAWLGDRAAKEGLANLEAIQAEADDPRLSEAVDLVFMCNVFHHLADPRAYFEAVAAKLAPAGRIVVVDFRPDNPEHAPGPPPQMRMSAAQISAIMREAGYTLSHEDRELLEYQYVLVFTAT